MDPVIEQYIKRGTVLLASKSPRRKYILEQQIGIKNFNVYPSAFAENLDKVALGSFEYALETSRQKALDVYRSEIDSDHPPSLVIAADTIIAIGNRILEKPSSAADHLNMLKLLRKAKVHKVYTGVTVMAPLETPTVPGYSLNSAVEETQVYFDEHASDDDLLRYVQTGEGNDAAGGYKIQAKGSQFIPKIEGDYYNVMGLPVKATIDLIKKTVNEAMNDEDL